MEECGPCPVFASFTLAFALQLRKKHGKTSVRVRKASVRLRKTSVTVQYTYYQNTNILKTHTNTHYLRRSRRLYPLCFEARVLYSFIIYSVRTSHPIITTSDNYFPKQYEEFFLYWRRSWNTLSLKKFKALFKTLRTGSFKLFKRPFPGFLTILTL